MHEEESESRVARWSRLKRQDAAAEDAPQAEPDPAPAPEETDADALRRLGLPEPETLTAMADFRAYLGAGLPASLRRRALRALWQAKPDLGRLDGLLDYDDDYTDAATVPDQLRTAWNIASGFAGAERAEAPVNPEPPAPPEAAPEADAPEPEEEAPPPRQAEAEDEGGTEPPALRRMRFTLPEGSRHMSRAEGAAAPEEEARAALYDLLAALLSAPPDGAALQRLAGMRGDEQPLGAALSDLAAAAASAAPQEVEREYNTLFIGLGRGELLPFASVYRDGQLNGRSLARLRADMATLGIARTDKRGEPEDHAATLLEIMAGLAAGRFGPAPGTQTQRRFFEGHVAPWMGDFLRDVDAAKGAVFYRPVARLGLIFLELEAEAFRLDG